MSKRLRSGFTTGACAAAAAKAAALYAEFGAPPERVEIPFPDGSRHSFMISSTNRKEHSVTACVVKDAGDDPDVTNGAEVCATFSKTILDQNHIEIDSLFLSAGEGIGTVTKAGLAIKPGEPAINPVPRAMITTAVREVNTEEKIYISISMPAGKKLARNTMNERLGIIGGLSILGTTGIVKPVSAHAWKATIETCMSVARRSGLEEVVLSTGRTSEKGVQQLLDLPKEAYAMMGDYLEFSFAAAKKAGFSTIHYAGMWAKVMKAAMHIPQTHVRNGALEMKDAAAMLKKLGTEPQLQHKLEQANTAREMLTHLKDNGREDIISAVCEMARDYGHRVSGRKVHLYLVDAQAKVVEHV